MSTEDTSAEDIHVPTFIDNREIILAARFEFDGHFGMDGALGRRDAWDGKTYRERFSAYLLDKMSWDLSISTRGTTWSPEKPTRIGLGYGDHVCSECGVKLSATFDGTVIRITSGEGPCPVPDGMPEFSFEISIPSGKMVFANDLREFYPKVTYSSVNASTGQRECSLAYAAVNMGHGMVGNSCPSIYRLAAGRFAIGTEGSEELPEGADEDAEPPGIPHEGEEVGSICTDLWWYSIGDLEEIKAKGYVPDNNFDKTFEVPPGRYKITHRWHTLDADVRTTPLTYALIEFVGPGTPPE
jgi:hypothetical protein